MEREYQQKIIRNLDFIARKVCCLSQLLNLLLQESVISEVEVAIIKSHKTEYESGTELANLICKKDTEKYPVFIKCLNESGNERIAKILTKHLSTGKETAKPIWLGITEPNRSYVGREQEMESLEKIWNNCLTKKILSIIAVTGLGGVGKSELAKNFAKWFYESVGGHCIWIEAETNRSLVESFQILAENLKISLTDALGKERIFLEIVAEVYQKLFGEKVLFVFDNVEDYELPVLKLLVDLSSKKSPTMLKPFVITTSRLVEAKKYFGIRCNLLDLQVLTKQHAMQFFYESLGFDESPEDSVKELITRLCERLQFFPLAMQQAAAYINERSPFCGKLQKSIASYLTEMEKTSTTLLNYKLPQYDALESTSKTTYLTWRLTIDKLMESKDGGEIVADIMNIISFLSPYHIPTIFVINILEKMGKLSKSANAANLFDVIRKHSMVDYIGNKILISVHRLVQEVARIELEERGEFRQLLSGIATCMQDMLEKEEISLKELVHVQVVCQHFNREELIIEKLEEHGELLRLISMDLYYAAKYRDLLAFSCGAGDLLDSVVGQKSRWTLMSKSYEGRALRELGEYKDSLVVLKDVYKRQKDIFGEEDKDCLETAGELGGAYVELKKYKMAMKIYKKVLENYERMYGKYGNEHLDTLAVKNNMALVLRGQSKLKGAMKLHKEILEVRERVLGLEDFETLSTKHNIATINLDLKKYKEALKGFKEVLEIQERVLEFNHPMTLTTKCCIAWTNCLLGRHKESLQLAREVYENRTQVLGPRHPDTITTRKVIKGLEKINSQRSSQSNSKIIKRKRAFKLL